MVMFPSGRQFRTLMQMCWDEQTIFMPSCFVSFHNLWGFSFQHRILFWVCSYACFEGKVYQVKKKNQTNYSSAYHVYASNLNAIGVAQDHGVKQQHPRKLAATIGIGKQWSSVSKWMMLRGGDSHCIRGGWDALHKLMMQVGQSDYAS